MMFKHPAFVGGSIAAAILLLGVVADPSVRGAIQGGGLYKVLQDLGGFIGALIALVGVVIAAVSTYDALDHSRREKVADRLRRHRVTVDQLARIRTRGQSLLHLGADNPALLDALEKFDERRESEAYLELASDRILKGDRRAVYYFGNTSGMSLSINGDVYRERSSVIAYFITRELISAIERRITMVESGADIEEISNATLVKLEKYHQYYANGTPPLPISILKDD
ncbi:MAG: hypothetical protein K0S00_4082 [Xanthobacteraceae bacterium]|jgi:hypothetical protein|nr:hypothetical protein [Xanthobacteraceae bacterium]